MKLNDINDIANSINQCLGNESVKTYDLWYRTKVRKIMRHKIFIDFEDAKKWIKKNKNKIIPASGNWQLLECFK